MRDQISGSDSDNNHNNNHCDNYTKSDRDLDTHIVIRR